MSCLALCIEPQFFELLQAALTEKARQVKARELETARLRALQEKAQDRQSQRDELRAKR